MHVRNLKGLGANASGVDSAQEAMEAIKDSNFTHVLSDGLEGGYKDVVSAAQSAGITNILVVTDDFGLKREVAEVGARYVDKGKLVSGKTSYEELIALNE
jgi:hypothetical protein